MCSNKTKKQNIKIILTALFFLAVGFGFFGANKAQAATCVCEKLSATNTGGEVGGEAGPAIIWTDPTSVVLDASSPTDCFRQCENESFRFEDRMYNRDRTNPSGFAEVSREELESSGYVVGDKPIEPGICEGTSIFSPSTWFNCFLLVILRLFGALLSVATAIFSWIMDPIRMDMVLNNDGIYQIWAMVRDTLNIAFILFLLLSAFATVFQVSKYSYKNTLLTLVIMALLVNFSYPITRFIIDFPNMMMYYFLNNLGVGNGTFTTLAKHSVLDKIITGGDVNSDMAYLLGAVIFVFIFTVTLLVIAVLFLIRTITLAILIIFSPLAFVGAAIPVSELSSNAGKWWSQLFKNAFWGPIMVFMIYVATTMMEYISTTGLGDMDRIAAGQNSLNGDFVAAASFFAIPIVILWIGLGMAQSLGAAGASAVTGQGQKFLKNVGGWAGNNLTGAGFVKGAWGAYKTRRKESEKDAWRNRVGNWIGSRQDQLSGIVPGRTGRDATNRYQRDLAGKVKQEFERRDMTNMSVHDLRDMSSGGNRFERAAAVQALAEKNSLDMTNEVDRNNYQRMKNEFGITSQVFNNINNKLRTYDPATAFSYIDNTDERTARITEFQESNQFDAEKLGTNSLGNEEFMRLAFRNGAVSKDNIEKLRGKSFYHERNIKNTLQSLAGEKEFNSLSQFDSGLAKARANVSNLQTALEDRTLSDERRIELQANLAEAQEALTFNEVRLRNARNVQMTHYAQNGRFHNSINGDSKNDQNARIQIISRLDKESGKRTDMKMFKNEKGELLAGRFLEFADNFKANKYKDFIQNMEDKNGQREFNTFMMKKEYEQGSSNAQSLYRLATNDNILKHIHD